jgi:hypothetical protein
LPIDYHAQKSPLASRDLGDGTEALQFMYELRKGFDLTIFMDSHGKKPRLSQHQRQVRFLGGLFLVVMSLVTILVFWLLNRH